MNALEGMGLPGRNLGYFIPKGVQPASRPIDGAVIYEYQLIGGRCPFFDLPDAGACKSEGIPAGEYNADNRPRFYFVMESQGGG